MSEQGRRVVAAVAAGRGFRRVPGGWQAGPLFAADALLAELAGVGAVRLVATGPVAPEMAAVPSTGDAACCPVVASSRLALGPPSGSDATEGGATTGAGRASGSRAASGRANLVATASAAASLPASLNDGRSPAPDRPQPAAARRNPGECPLAWLHARGLVSARQHDAGERLRDDWTMAGLAPRVTMRWDAGPTARGRRGADAPLDPTLAGIAARRRFDGAVAAAGTGLSDILWRVVCAGEGLEAAEGALGWPRRAGKLVLLMALDRVADYYRLP